jgi:hypothetical protein
VKQVLEEIKVELVKPFGDARRKLILILNILYLVLVIVFLSSEKIATGHFVPNDILWAIYVPAVLLNCTSAIYNYNILKSRDLTSSSALWRKILERKSSLDNLSGWLSLIPIMLMSFCNMIGLGNPSSDSILTDFALGHSLIIGAILILGRKPALFWFLTVLLVLFYDVQTKGWDYEYHYLTPNEVVNYKKELAEQKPSAIKRKNELAKSNLNPPKITRYFNTWLVFIIVAFIGAYYFSGITLDIFKILPSVVRKVETAMENTVRMQVEIEEKSKENTRSAMRIVRYNDMLSKLNQEIEKLEYQEKKKLIGLINVVRKTLNREADWQNFEINFDNIHGNFFKSLKGQYPQLSESEIRHLAYLKMRLTNPEVSKLMEIKMESLRTLRHRIKKKLGLPDDLDLRSFVQNIEQNKDSI